MSAQAEAAANRHPQLGGQGAPEPPRVRLTDSTLRDGSHALAHQFTEEQVRGVVNALDGAGVEVIEVSHGDGLGGSSFNYGFSLRDEFELITAAVEEAHQARIAVLLLPGVGTIEDLKHARDVGASVARIATHCTEADVSVQHFGAAREMGMETVGFLMLAHRIGPAALAAQAPDHGRRRRPVRVCRRLGRSSDSRGCAATGAGPGPRDRRRRSGRVSRASELVAGRGEQRACGAGRRAAGRRGAVRARGGGGKRAD